MVSYLIVFGMVVMARRLYRWLKVPPEPSPEDPDAYAPLELGCGSKAVVDPLPDDEMPDLGAEKDPRRMN